MNLAPNGKPSNLTPEQYRLVRTPAFKKWFGDWENDIENSSKVVDENGEPLVVYHKTDNKFTIFDKEKLGSKSQWGTAYFGFYFSNKYERVSYGKRAIKCFLNIRNPYLIESETYADYDFEYKRFDVNNFSKNDGIVIKTIRLVGNEKADKHFVAFEPNQIKLAKGNTTFDGNNPDIRYADGGYIGSCVDVGSGKKEVCKYFPDATIMAQYVGNPDENDWGKSKETTSKEFYKFVSKNDVPKKAINGEHSYHYIAEDSYGRDMTINDTAIYFIYNVDSDIHYFFKKTKYELGGELTLTSEQVENKLAPKLLAPNGKPSNLTPEQYRLVRTTAFKKWFGDWEKAYQTGNYENVSKVIDEETKEPLVVYHGTTKDFNEFNYSENAINDFGIEGRGFYFSNKEGIAKQYAKRFIKELGDFDTTGGRVIEVFLKIVNPASRKETSVLMSKHKDFETNARETQIELIKQGFNGVIKKYPSGDNAYEFVVFNSTQIKLADGTNTTFDSNNPDIRYKKGGEVLLAPNGKPSNLTPEQYRLVRTPEFISWFGDWINSPEKASKVVDENGEPLVCYHSTTKEFFIFNRKNAYYKNWYGLGFYFTNSLSDIDKNYTREGKDINDKIKELSKKIGLKNAKKELLGNEDLILSVFLNIKNPIHLDKKLSKKDYNNFFKSLDKIKHKYFAEGIDDLSSSLEQYVGNNLDFSNFTFWDIENLIRGIGINLGDKEEGQSEMIRDIYENMGYDGIFMNVYDIFNVKEKRKMKIDRNVIHYISFFPNQIKLAKGNTTFDSTNPDIRYSKGGNIGFEHTLKEVYPNIFLLQMTSQNDLANTFARCQAFYEWDAFKGKKFNLQEYFDWYKVNHPDLNSYQEEFYGFNVPSNVIADCYKINDERNEYDKFLLNVISNIKNKEYYLIGALKGDETTLNHELAHAFFWEDESYKNDMTELVNSIPNKKELFDILSKERGYGKNVLIDEAQAFLSTGLIVNISDWEKYREPFKKRFSEQKYKYKNGGLIETLSIEQVERNLGRKINSWKDDVIYISGQKYKKVFLRPEYKADFDKFEYGGQNVCKVGTEVQSLIFSKDFFNKSSAKNWAKEHGYKYEYIDEKENTYRIRQKNPNYFLKNIFRTISLKKGVKAVIACPKK